MHYFVFITNTVCVSMIKSFAKLQIISEAEKAESERDPYQPWKLYVTGIVKLAASHLLKPCIYMF